MIKKKILPGALAVLIIPALLLTGCTATITQTPLPSISAKATSTVTPITTPAASPVPAPVPTTAPTPSTTASPAPTDVPAPTPKPSPTNSPAPSIKFEGSFIDVHTHIGETSLEQIIQNMDIEGIDTMVIMGTPSAIDKGIPPETYGIPGAAEKYPDRFIALYAGEAITMLDIFADKTYTQADEDKYVALLEAAMQTGQYAGFGEIALRHFPVPFEPGSSDVTVPGDHPWMFILSDIAAKYDVPIDIHMEATDETLPGLERLLAHNPNAKIIWSHAGWGNTDVPTPRLMRQLMEKYPNLYTSIKIRKAETPEMIAISILDEKGQIKSEWMALFKDYPERFMIGSDIKPGLREDEFKYIKAHRAVLEQLPPNILKKIERDNAIKLFKIQ